MSLGWQSESALLPSKAKPINVDAKSMLSLKAIVYDTERLLSGDKTNQKNRSLIRVKGRDDGLSKVSEKEKIFVPRNEAPTNLRLTSNAKPPILDSRESKIESVLRTKAAIYDQIKSGRTDTGGNALSSRSATSGAGYFLVDFESKRKLEGETFAEDTGDSRANKAAKYDDIWNSESSVRHNDRSSSSSSSSSSSLSRQKGEDGDELAEIIDEFGRSKWVPRKSREYERYLLSYKPSQNDSASVSAPVRYDRDDERQWQWSTGADHAGTADWKRDIIEQRGLKALVEERVEKELRLSDAARVKTQWEKALYSSAREFLEDVQRDLERDRDRDRDGSKVIGNDIRDNNLGKQQRGQEEQQQYDQQPYAYSKRGEGAHEITGSFTDHTNSNTNTAGAGTGIVAPVVDDATLKRLGDRRELLRQKKLKAQQLL